MLDQFCKDLEHEIPWDALLLQEFSFTGVEFENSRDGHLVLAQPPFLGQRRSAIIVHERVAGSVKTATFRSVGRSCSVDLQWGGWCLRLVSAHLFSGQSIQRYRDSVRELETLCTTRMPKQYVVIGVDAQDVLGPSHSDDSHVIGEFAEEGRLDKGEEFLQFCLAHRLAVLNTMAHNPSGTYACNYYNKRSPRQIDFLCTDLPPTAGATSRVHQSAATVSDHRALIGHIKARVQKMHGFENLPATTAKPIRWSCTDPAYNSLIRSSLGMPDEQLPSSCPMDAFHVYTDGSCIIKRRQVVTAGWGFALLCFGAEPSSGQQPEVKACGPVVTDQMDTRFVGARRLTNNTGELSAVIEFLLWALAETDSCQNHILLDAPIVVHTDSTYVLGILVGKFRAPENRAISLLAVHLWQMARKRFEMHIVWVKGHNGHYGNECVDAAAKCGSDASCQELW